MDPTIKVDEGWFKTVEEMFGDTPGECGHTRTAEKVMEDQARTALADAASTAKGFDSGSMSAASPVTRGTEPRIETIPEGALVAEHLAQDWVLLVIRNVVLALSVVIWSVIGFLVWIPLLVRAILLLSGAVLYSSLLRRDAKRAESRLRHAIEFFPSGYTKLIEAVRQRHKGDDDEGSSSWLDSIKHLLQFALELLIAGAFWYLVGALIRAWELGSLWNLLQDGLWRLGSTIQSLFKGA